MNTVHNNFLDWYDKSTPSQHPVFGKVTSGMDVVMKISGVRTGEDGRFRCAVPSVSHLAMALAAKLLSQIANRTTLHRHTTRRQRQAEDPGHHELGHNRLSAQLLGCDAAGSPGGSADCGVVVVG